MIFSKGLDEKKEEPSKLHMYKIPPIHKISLEEFESVAIERLKLLRDVETFGIRSTKDSSEYEKNMGDSLKKFLKFTYSTDDQKTIKSLSYHKDLEEELRKDKTSHFILRLAYCRSDELRRWFIAQEVDLFKYRFQREEFKEKEKFLEQNQLNYSPISEEEKKSISTKLADSEYKMNEKIVEETSFYKVPFTDALDLVRSRKVFLKKGFAYVSQYSLVSIISNCFKIHLSEALALTARSLPYLDEDERLLPRLTSLSRQYLGEGYDSKKEMPGGKITLGQMDLLSRTSFPLCMRQLHEALRKHHHLKHGGRLQYGLFIKGLGLTLEEALAFWRSEFAKIMEVDKFEKSYSYSVRHSYGKEGKRADYTPYSCMKIIMSNHPGNGDYHGCPFRHSDVDILRQKLVNYGIPQSAIIEIQELVTNSHYQLACARYFEVTHKLTLSQSDVINHPNKYVEESRRIHEEIASGNKKTESIAHSSISHIYGSGKTRKFKLVNPVRKHHPVSREIWKSIWMMMILKYLKT
ncbi:DNA primase large subunit-like [Xenia sp. Carnegie-2017]|uniref:DNA primase large subunit-like n=1 Tax=Xenia sp. Carnegie-2017 TaxID=2897299 RepID=UPI001F048DDF|nr:DNA primase large subunit-like [Xenia sp. Carnegie-2017]